MVKTQESKCCTQVQCSEMSRGNIQSSLSKSKTTSRTDSNIYPGTEPSRLINKSQSHSRTRIPSRVRFSDMTTELDNTLSKSSKAKIQLDSDSKDLFSSKCFENHDVLTAMENQTTSERKFTTQLPDSLDTENALGLITSESKSIKKSKTFIFIKKKNDHTLLGENETRNVLEVDRKMDTQPEEEEDQIISTSELLDPEVPTDGLSSSKSTPGDLTNVPDELAEADTTQQPPLRKILSSKRSTSATRLTETEKNLNVAPATASSARAKYARRKLSERHGLFDMVSDNETIRDALLSPTLPRRRCRLFPFGVDLRDDAKKVSASRSLDGEWSISDHPNHKVLPKGPLFAQESAFPTFYDKIEIPVPLPPWDDPGFSLENEPSPPPLQPQQRPAQSLPAVLMRSEPTSEPTSSASSRCGIDSREDDK